MYSILILKGCSRTPPVVCSGLPQTKLGTYLETRVNSFLKKKDSGAGEVTIRVLASSRKVVEVKSGMKARYCGEGREMSESFPYLAKAIFAFEEIEGVDVCFFGMHVQEYGTNADAPNTRSDLLINRKVILLFLSLSTYYDKDNNRNQLYMSVLYMLHFNVVHLTDNSEAKNQIQIFVYKSGHNGDKLDKRTCKSRKAIEDKRCLNIRIALIN